jgi:hypothetical protein
MSTYLVSTSLLTRCDLQGHILDGFPWPCVRKAAPGHVTTLIQDTLSAYYISAVSRHSDNHQLTHSTTFPADRSFCVRSANILGPWDALSIKARSKLEQIVRTALHNIKIAILCNHSHRSWRNDTNGDHCHF